MHEYLRAVGFRSIRTKKQLNGLIDRVIKDPDHLSIVSTGEETNLAVAEKEVSGHAGIAVVGEIDEQGTLVPEYYFPYLSSSQISSEAHLSWEKQAAKDGYIGMCEDYRMGMALIFFVRNMTEIARSEYEDPFHADFSKVAFSALASEGTVLLPLLKNEKVLKKAEEDTRKRSRLMEQAREGSPEAIDAIARSDMQAYQRIVHRLRESDVFTVVESFFMPYGMESDQYYLMGDILALQTVTNEWTKEQFYRMLVNSNGMTLSVAIHTEDLEGVPAVGDRIKCRAWLMGDMKR